MHRLKTVRFPSLWLGVLAGLGAALTHAAPAESASYDITAYSRSFVYGEADGLENHLYIWDPIGFDGPRPATIFIHGGGFTGGRDVAHLSALSASLSKVGIAAITIQYRLAESRAQVRRDLHKCVEDAQAAFRYVVEHAAELNIDPNRIAVGGASAGGFLTLTTTFLPHREAPAWTRRPNLLFTFFPAVRGDWTTDSDITPHLAGKLPPLLVMQGDQDKVTPLANAEWLGERWRALGGEFALSVYPGEGHGFARPRKNPNNYHRTLREVIGFLAQHGWIDRRQAE